MGQVSADTLEEVMLVWVLFVWNEYAYTTSNTSERLHVLPVKTTLIQSTASNSILLYADLFTKTMYNKFIASD